MQNLPTMPTRRACACGPAGRRTTIGHLLGAVLGLGLALASCTRGEESDGSATLRAAGSRPAPSGTLSGRLAYPSEDTPPMTIYVMDATGAPETRFVRTAWNQRRYALDLPPGRYFVFAIPDERMDSTVVGAHTDFSPCNARQILGEAPDPPCRTSPPREIVVRSGIETNDADIDDWYLSEDVALNLNALARGARERAASRARP